MPDYLNRNDVRQALNIPSYVQEFQDCNDEMYNTYKVLLQLAVLASGSKLKIGKLQMNGGHGLLTVSSVDTLKNMVNLRLRLCMEQDMKLHNGSDRMCLR